MKRRTTRMGWLVVAVNAGTGDVTSLAPAEFQNQQAIVKFSLKRQDGTTPVEASNLTVKVGNETYNVTLATPASDIFVAIKTSRTKLCRSRPTAHQAFSPTTRTASPSRRAITMPSA